MYFLTDGATWNKRQEKKPSRKEEPIPTIFSYTSEMESVKLVLS